MDERGKNTLPSILEASRWTGPCSGCFPERSELHRSARQDPDRISAKCGHDIVLYIAQKRDWRGRRRV